MEDAAAWGYVLLVVAGLVFLGLLLMPERVSERPRVRRLTLLWTGLFVPAMVVAATIGLGLADTPLLGLLVVIWIFRAGGAAWGWRSLSKAQR